MKQLMKEPMLHFVLLGAALFVAYGWLNPEPEPEPERIVVTPGHIEHLATTFARTWQRPPTADELEALVDGYVEEEVFTREAIRLGLDRDDTVIRRRLKQKLEFVTDDIATIAEPSDAELETYLEDHAEVFRQPSVFAFTHVYLNPDRGDRLAGDAADLLAKLRGSDAAVDPAEVGDRLLLPAVIRDEPAPAVASMFGREFTAALEDAPIGEWFGPVRSGYGFHLIRLAAREPGRTPELAEVRDRVARELLNERRLAANRQFRERLLAKYDVRVEWPEPAVETGSDETAMVNP